MSLIDKAKKFIGDNPDKVRQGIEKVGDQIDKRTGGKYADKIDRVQAEAANRLGDNSAGTDPAAPTDPKDAPQQ
ncbi:MAG TPA: antitoxin [Corynebacterium sp.]|uniref:antitoxin n=1 Tax=Corynebacterium sp. TaxID=1720 RepID=UPI0017D99D3A|nr:antitoxin [Corynebacterium sp.]HHT31637.1 antitoxin [Corynebacterium sp.]